MTDAFAELSITTHAKAKARRNPRALNPTLKGLGVYGLGV